MPVAILGPPIDLAVSATRRPRVISVRPLRLRGIIIDSQRRSVFTVDALRLLVVQIAQYLLDPILMGDRFVEAELDLRHAPQAKPAAEMTP
jgi:hypothetical protein